MHSIGDRGAYRVSLARHRAVDDASWGAQRAAGTGERRGVPCWPPTVSLPWWARTLRGQPRRPARYELVAVESRRYGRYHICLYRFLVREWLVTIFEPATEPSADVDGVEANTALPEPGLCGVDHVDSDGHVEVSKHRYWRDLSDGSDAFGLEVAQRRTDLATLCAARGEWSET